MVYGCFRVAIRVGPPIRGLYIVKRRYIAETSFRARLFFSIAENEFSYGIPKMIGSK
jgi:hypothetical protein